MRKYTPVNFTSVKPQGQFWKERLDTVQAKTIPSQHVQLGKSGILDSQTVKSKAPPAHPSQSPWKSSGIPTSANG